MTDVVRALCLFYLLLLSPPLAIVASPPLIPLYIFFVPLFFLLTDQLDLHLDFCVGAVRRTLARLELRRFSPPCPALVDGAVECRC